MMYPFSFRDTSDDMKVVFCTGKGCGCHYVKECPRHGLDSIEETSVTKAVKEALEAK